MKVEFLFAGKAIYLKFFPDEDDARLFAKTIHLSSRACFFQLPIEVTPQQIHPDLLALSALLLCYPFTDKRLDLDFPVSEEFSSLCVINLGITIGNKSSLIPRRRIDDGIPALGYSGGVDSSAALALMPEKKLVFFIDRVQPYAKKSLYNKYAAHAAFSELTKKEPHAHLIPTDFEYLRSKVGFPVDSLNVDIPHPVAVPALLMADHYKIDSISYGVIMESVYMVGHERFEDYSLSVHYRKWTPFFDIVACKLFLPTAGVTEIGTAIITEKTRFSHFIRSCMRGDQNGPCGKCIKCLRKSLLIHSLSSSSPDISVIEDNLDSTQVVANIYGPINQHENVYRYIAHFLPRNRFSSLLRDRLVIDTEDCQWMERWFPDSIDLVPEKYRIDFLSKLFKYLAPMTAENISFVKSWDVSRQRNTDAVALMKWQRYVYDSTSPKVKKYIDQNFK